MRKAPKTQGKAAPKSVKAKAKKLYQQGMSFAAISKEIGYDRQTIGRWSKEDKWRELNILDSPPQVEKPKPTRSRKQPEPQPVTAKGEANNVVPLDSARERKSILQNCKDIREQLRTAVERLVHDQDYRPLGSVATAFERIARLEIELDPLSPYEWVKVAVERGWDVTQLAEAVVEERRVG